MAINLKKYWRAIGQNMAIVAKNGLLWSKIAIFVLVHVHAPWLRHALK